MSQGFLFGHDLSLPLSTASIQELAAFERHLAKSQLEPATVASEVSQLRSLARQAEQRSALTLRDLRDRPKEAIPLIEEAGMNLHVTTVQVRVRAFQRYLMMDASAELGKERVRAFRAALPKKTPRGWHDAGVSVPGTKVRRRMPGPTPTIEALEQIVEAGTSRSLASGAIAALACFSGLDEKEILQLRWKDLQWLDDGISSCWELRIPRRGRKTTVFVVGLGVQPLLRHGLSSGLEREAFVLQGRMPGTSLSERAFRNDLKASCSQAGWPKATRSQLTAGLAAWLRNKEFDDHSIRLILGRRRAASIDRMLHRRDQLDAQITIDSAAARRR